MTCFHIFPFHFGITCSGSLAVRFGQRRLKTVLLRVLDPGISKVDHRNGFGQHQQVSSDDQQGKLKGLTIPKTNIAVNQWLEDEVSFLGKPIFRVLC